MAISNVLPPECASGTCDLPEEYGTPLCVLPIKSVMENGRVVLARHFAHRPCIMEVKTLQGSTLSHCRTLILRRAERRTGVLSEHAMCQGDGPETTYSQVRWS